ncbi:MAG: orotidine 5'-phosphate decarboxylase, partial [Thermoplasmata archaeon]|nr:orotidine 5'-phosphate decarboxylase [Thermoplasmata archaeon]
MERKNRILLALDVTSRERALEVVDAVREHVDGIKVNWPLILAAGPQIITDLSGVKPVVCDLKIADIPNTNRLIV